MVGSQIGKKLKLNNISTITKKAISLVLTQISNSHIEEDPEHAVEMLYLALNSKYSKHETFIIASVAHDLERSVNCRLKPQEFSSYNEYKDRHQKRSAELTAKLLSQLNLPPGFIKQVKLLISYHEFGGPKNPYLEELRYLDTLSFINTNARYYLEREGYKILEERIKWGVSRLNPVYIQRLINEVRKSENIIVDILIKTVNGIKI